MEKTIKCRCGNDMFYDIYVEMYICRFCGRLLTLKESERERFREDARSFM